VYIKDAFVKNSQYGSGNIFYLCSFFTRERKGKLFRQKLDFGLPVTAATDGTYRGGFFALSRFCPTGLIFGSSRKYFP
jgi:hypothetical protein